MLSRLPSNSAGTAQSLQSAPLLLGDIGRNIQVDAPTDTVRGRTFRGMRRHGTFGPITGSGRDPESIVDTNPRNPKHLVNCLDVTFHVRLDVLSRRRNVAHLQCACQGAEQSTTDGADHIVQRRGYVLFGFDSVKGLDSTMDTEPYWFLEAFKISMSYRTSYTFES